MPRQGHNIKGSVSNPPRVSLDQSSDVDASSVHYKILTFDDNT